ncbi:MAG TPA: low-specificity L-threonine aldolase [Planctomycetaceae bacterium]|jgi:threonine aldolase|nr:low-specificity L-threonine aldolase [Planctomycetaceae bacterium]
MSSRPIYDLRSDTVTKPSPAMRQAMANAEVGDDMSAEDPTVNRLEKRCAELFGKEAAVFACTATQANQMAVRVHCQPGDELLIHETGHIANFEAGGPAALSGVSCRTLPGERGLLDVAQLKGNVRADDQHLVQTRLVCVENTANMGGGHAWPIEQLARVASWARELGLKVHMDGARLFNATVARGYSPKELGRHVDTIAICFSKGLGCPMGAILVGSTEEIRKARRARKMLGGALRQAGIVAAAAEYALEHNVERLAEDHANARQLAAMIAKIRGLRINVDAVETNLVFFDVDPALGFASQLANALESRGVLIHDSGPQRLRACTHLDVRREDIPEVGRILAECVESGFRDRPGSQYGGFWRG